MVIEFFNFDEQLRSYVDTEVLYICSSGHTQLFRDNPYFYSIPDMWKGHIVQWN